MQDLEARLLEHPDDEATWQVYADWLLEHGDARGTVIGLEQRLGSERSASARDALAKEIAAIEAAHAPAWREDLPDAIVARWKHGFATAIGVTWCENAVAQIAEALALPACRFVRRVWFAARPMDPDEEEDIDVYEDGLPMIEHGETLADLELGACTALDLSYLRLGDDNARALAACPALAQLTTLDLRYTELGDDGLAALAPRLASVERLHLQRNRLTARGITAIAKLPRLVELDLRYNALGIAGAEVLASAAFLPQLAKLSLYRADVTPDGVRALGASKLPAPLRMFWRAP